MRKRPSLWEKIVAATMCLALNSASWAQATSQAPQPPAGQQSTPEAPAPATPQPEAAPPSIAQQAKSLDGPPAPAGQLAPFHVELPHSRNPLSPYRPSTAPAVDLTNSPRLESLERDGKLYLSLRDVVALALENNLDLAYFRYNLPIAQADLARTKAGADESSALAPDLNQQPLPWRAGRSSDPVNQRSPSPPRWTPPHGPHRDLPGQANVVARASAGKAAGGERGAPVRSGKSKTSARTDACLRASGRDSNSLSLISFSSIYSVNSGHRERSGGSHAGLMTPSSAAGEEPFFT
jgi:hypothetical protein